MNKTLKLWTGIGTYVLASASMSSLAVTDASQSPPSATPPAALVGQGNVCQPMPVSDGGEGGEGGGAIAPRLSTAVVLPPEQQFRDRQIVANFVDQLVVPNYEQLAQRAGELAAAIDAFARAPSDRTLASARQAWLVARTPWEQSEAFAFGPADFLEFDPALDEWPLDEREVVAILASGDALTFDYVAALPEGVKGFHAIAFLLFGTAADKPLSAFTPRELAYLGAIAPVFEQNARDLLASWTEGIDDLPPYRETFVAAGAGSTAYPTVQAAGEEIVQGILGLLDELANVKIGDALERQNPFLLESRFAQSSLQDFQDNLAGAKNAYLGRFDPNRPQARGLRDFVAALDPALEAEIQAQMATAQVALAAIPGPIEQTLCDRAAYPAIVAAQATVLDLFDTFEMRVLPLVQQ